MVFRGGPFAGDVARKAVIRDSFKLACRFRRRREALSLAKGALAQCASFSVHQNALLNSLHIYVKGRGLRAAHALSSIEGGSCENASFPSCVVRVAASYGTVRPFGSCSFRGPFSEAASRRALRPLRACWARLSHTVFDDCAKALRSVREGSFLMRAKGSHRLFRLRLLTPDRPIGP